jgi:hypothetical protein
MTRYSVTLRYPSPSGQVLTPRNLPHLAQPPREGGEVSGQLCELLHIGGPKSMGALFRQAQRDAEEMQMRIGIGIAVVLAIGLIWSVAAMFEWVPVVSAG